MVLIYNISTGYYDSGTFGTMKKDIKRPFSNFNFEFKGKFVAAKSSSTGYLEVIQEHNEDESDFEDLR